MKQTLTRDPSHLSPPFTLLSQDMAMRHTDPLFCDNVGETNNSLQCCYLDDQDSPICQENFNNPKKKTFLEGCPNRNCITDCQNLTLLYSSILQVDPTEGNGKGPIRRYLTCANVPNMAQHFSRSVLDPKISMQIERHVSRDASIDSLKGITFTVTECLTATCRNARDKEICQNQCSSVNLLINSTTPNITGLNQCLNSLCTGNYHSLPYADADVIGVGVSDLFYAHNAWLTQFF